MSVPPAATQHYTAADVMTPNPRTCSTFSTVLEAVLLFRDADCGAVPILDNGKAVGLLTDRDVALALIDKPDLPSCPVSEIMTSGVVSIPPETPLSVLREKFGDEGVRRLLVVDSRDQLLGIIAWADIARFTTEQALGQTVAEVVE
jgi:CBS domain-containing protein